MWNNSAMSKKNIRSHVSVKERMRTQREFLPSLCSTTKTSAAAAMELGNDSSILPSIGRADSHLEGRSGSLPPLSRKAHPSKKSLNHSATTSAMLYDNDETAGIVCVLPYEGASLPPRSESVPLMRGPSSNVPPPTRMVCTPSFRQRRKLHQGTPGAYRLPLNDDELSEDDELDERAVRQEALARQVRSVVGTPAEGAQRRPSMPSADSTSTNTNKSVNNKKGAMPTRGSIPLVDDDIAVPEKALRSLVAFDMSVEEKQLLADYVRNGKQGPAPTLIVGYFKYAMTEATSLFVTLREEVPLAAIEGVIDPLPIAATYNSTQFIRQILNPILVLAQKQGCDALTVQPNDIVQQQAMFLFDLFDTDDDGQLSKIDLCNGFVQVRSVDGALIPVLHRCITMIAPTAKREAKLAMITRLEVQHMCEAILTVVTRFVDDAKRNTKLLKEAISREYPPVAPKGKEMQQLKAQQHDVRLLVNMLSQCTEDLNTLRDTFACDRRGSLSYYEVRQFLTGRPAVKHAISLLRVPRDDDLWESFLSETYRSATVDDVSSRRDFRPSRNPLVDALEIQRKLAAKDTVKGTSTTASITTNTNTAADDLGHSTIVAIDREAVEHEAPTYYSMKGTLYRQTIFEESPQIVAKGSYVLEDAKGRKVRNLF